MPFKIHFFLEKGLRIFFLDLLQPPPQIINGRPLSQFPCTYAILMETVIILTCIKPEISGENSVNKNNNPMKMTNTSNSISIMTLMY